ncbi:hypothetical protein [Streptomyces sp. NPDC093591]
MHLDEQLPYEEIGVGVRAEPSATLAEAALTEATLQVKGVEGAGS